MFTSNSLFAQTEFAVTNNSSCDYWVRYGYDTNCSSPYTFTSGYIQVQASATYTATIPAGEELYRNAVAPDVNGLPGTPFQVWNCTTGGVEFDTHGCGAATDEVENTGLSIKIEEQ